MITPVIAPDMANLSPVRLQRMMAAGVELKECVRVLANAGLNVVGECLRGQGVFYEVDHYPSGDVYDNRSGSQYYYHHHRESDEHGHFHTFVRADQTQPTHLIAISMDMMGLPVGLFTTNRWVTAERMLPAPSVLELVDRFRIDHAHPNWAVNRWLGAMLKLFFPQIQALLEHRDQVLQSRAEANPDQRITEDPSLDVIGELAISVDEQIAALKSLVPGSQEAVSDCQVLLP